MRYNFADGAHPERNTGVCDRHPECYDIVEEHQLPVPLEVEKPDVPEFIIETSYVAGDPTMHPGEPCAQGTSSLFASGWKYVLKWYDGKKTITKTRRGYDSEASALNAAKARADREARALTPVRVTKYTPRI